MYIISQRYIECADITSVNKRSTIITCVHRAFCRRELTASFHSVEQEHRGSHRSLGSAFLWSYTLIEHSPNGIMVAPREPAVKMLVRHPILSHDEL